jgi:cell division protein FtsN
MFVKVSAGALLALGLGAFAALAQSTADVGGPRERPPAGFSGQQYVDSRGCVFLRAGLGGAVNWVPRVDRNRRAMCGYPPTFGGGGTRVAAAEAPAPQVVTPRPAAPVRVTTAEPPPASYVPAPVTTMRPQAAKPAAMPVPAATVAAPVTAPVVVPRAGQGGQKVGCLASTPVPQRLRLTNGGTVIVCTRGDGTLEGLRAPVYPQGVGASLSHGIVPLGQPSGVGSGAAGARVATHGAAVPHGYKLAWKDDRLNPLRGVGTAEGQASQDQVWTRQLPARTTEEAKVTVSSQSAPAAARVTASTKSQPAAAPVERAVQQPSAAGRFFVQVGSFGVPANAEGAAARLSALGLPVARAKGRIGGKAVQVVMAGPFASTGEAQVALRSARGAGFGDAFVK